METSQHIHEWRKIHEQVLLGGAFPVGYKCRTCGEFVSINSIPVTGLGGIDTNEHELYGPHGGLGQCSDGSTFKSQFVSSDGILTIKR